MISRTSLNSGVESETEKATVVPEVKPTIPEAPLKSENSNFYNISRESCQKRNKKFRKKLIEGRICSLSGRYFPSLILKLLDSVSLFISGLSWRRRKYVGQRKYA